MNIGLSKRWQDFVEESVDQGRFGSPGEVVEEGLRLLAEQDAKLAWLRDKIARSVEEGGDVSEEELDAALDAKEKELIARGY